eukprot:Gregarina_sp_Poly_1__4611@NODE_246_length_10752_cov_151_576135_g216_i0_p6_GENE_NODE_246_length_10752_cov_151_576135_g216_i0NODE_246_length_10752_cov_151_576135_g216_i0_p6_ORF_typecomplete_len194_score13_96_NODE_246_length_10752_cov_151_576135_g216_i0984510426
MRDWVLKNEYHAAGRGPGKPRSLGGGGRSCAKRSWIELWEGSPSSGLKSGKSVHDNRGGDNPKISTTKGSMPRFMRHTESSTFKLLASRVTPPSTGKKNTRTKEDSSDINGDGCRLSPVAPSSPPFVNRVVSPTRLGAGGEPKSSAFKLVGAGMSSKPASLKPTTVSPPVVVPFSNVIWLDQQPRQYEIYRHV